MLTREEKHTSDSGKWEGGRENHAGTERAETVLPDTGLLEGEGRLLEVLMGPAT